MARKQSIAPLPDNPTAGIRQAESASARFAKPFASGPLQPDSRTGQLGDSYRPLPSHRLNSLVRALRHGTINNPPVRIFRLKNRLMARTEILPGRKITLIGFPYFALGLEVVDSGQTLLDPLSRRLDRLARRGKAKARREEKKKKESR